MGEAGREAGRDRVLANERADDRRRNTHFPDRADRRRTDGNDHLGVSRHKIARHRRKSARPASEVAFRSQPGGREEAGRLRGRAPPAGRAGARRRSRPPLL